MAGWIQDTFGTDDVSYRVMGAIISIGVIILLVGDFFCRKSRITESAQEESESSSEESHLMKSESCSSSASAFADDSTEVYIKRLKYDSMNKYVKDW
jgi:hypothetical protein